MTGATSRRKGASAEREFARALDELLGVRLARNLEQSRQGGHDLIAPESAIGPVAEALAGLAIEIKRYATTPPGSLAQWWKQAVSQGERAHLWPVLAYRGDRQAWRVRLPLACLWPATFALWDALDLTLDLSLSAFACLVREGLLPESPPAPAAV
jgi:hypothetical protein